MFKFAVCISANNKLRFYADIQLSKGPDVLVIKVGAFQGHTQQSPLFDPSLTGTEIRTLLEGNLHPLGIVYHLSPVTNTTSIKRMGLLANPDPNVQGRLAVHFLFHPRNKDLLREGTQYSSYEGKVSAFRLDLSKFYIDDPSRQVYLTENGVILFHGNIPPRYLEYMGDYSFEQRNGLVEILEFIVSNDDDFDCLWDTSDAADEYRGGNPGGCRLTK